MGVQLNSSFIQTGGARGIGEAISLELGKQGFRVVVNYSSPSSSDKAKRTVARIKGLNSDAVAVEADLGKLENLQRIVDTAIEAFGRIDVLVNIFTRRSLW